MKLPFPIASGLEKAIESLLKLDPDTRSRLAPLDGKVIRINVTSPPLSLAVAIVDGCVHLDAPDDNDAFTADTTITGSLSALTSLTNSNNAVYSGEVLIEGDIETSQHVKQIVAHLDPDWQEAVSAVLGDGLTHKLDVAGAQLMQWMNRTRQSSSRNTSEYLQEELEVLAPNTCVHGFNDDVDQLRADADRLTARIAQLENNQHAKAVKE